MAKKASLCWIVLLICLLSLVVESSGYIHFGPIPEPTATALLVGALPFILFWRLGR